MNKLIIGAFILFLSSCSNDGEVNVNVAPNVKKVVEMNSFNVYKITVDSVDYLVVRAIRGGTAIIKHSQK